MKIAASIVFAFSSLVTMLLIGCASMEASSTESLLSAAGFVARSPADQQQVQMYNALPPYTVHRGEVNGRVLYAYKDEKQGLAFVGNEAAYQQYKMLSIQKQIASDSYAAAEMNREVSWGWHGAYGRWAGFPPMIIP